MNDYELIRDALEQAVLEGLHETELPKLFAALTRIEAERQQASKDVWISVEDRLPEPEGMVLTYEVGVIEATDAFYVAEMVNDISHWMPLPEPPANTKGDGDNGAVK